MKKWIALIVLVLIGGAVFHLRSKYKEGAELAAPDTVKDLTSSEITEGIRSADPKTRLDAVAQIEKLPLPERKVALLGALGASYAPTRLTALTALTRSFADDVEVVGRLLLTAKEDPDSDVRETAFVALEKSGDPRVLELAIAALESTEEPLKVRLSAARTLDRLTGRTAAASFAGSFGEAEATADDLSMDWDGWFGERKGRLSWDPAAGRFIEKD